MTKEREQLERGAKEACAMWDKHLAELEAMELCVWECREWKEHALWAEEAMVEQAREAGTIMQQGSAAAVEGKSTVCWYWAALMHADPFFSDLQRHLDEVECGVRASWLQMRRQLELLYWGLAGMLEQLEELAGEGVKEELMQTMLQELAQVRKEVLHSLWLDEEGRALDKKDRMAEM
jgi:hypothetical protein